MTRARASAFLAALACLACLAAPVEAAAARAQARGKAEASDGLTVGQRAKKIESKKPWIKRWAPERNMVELGLFTGVFVPSTEHDLYDPRSRPPEPFWAAGGEIGARVGYYPLRPLGVELDFAAMPTKLRSQTNDPALIYGFKASVVFQLPFYRIAPFFLAGGGLLGVYTKTLVLLGNDKDPAIHYGGGVKFFIHRLVQARIDLRQTVSASEAVQNSGTKHLEVLAGVSVTLARKRHKPLPKPLPPEDPDRDNDKILNVDDGCPDDPGLPPHGCPDTDGDTFPDNKDACPEVPGVAPDGCPVKDSDNDRINDPVDDCVYEPETWNGFKDGDGCPDEPPPEIKEFTGTIPGIEFDFKKDTIRASSKGVLDRAVAVLKEYPDVKVNIVGHTDDVGTPEFNLDLSKRRAEAVKKYLTDGGVDESRITTEGRGASEPVAENTTEAGRAKNRRIDFEVTNSKPDKPAEDEPSGKAPKAKKPAKTDK